MSERELEYHYGPTKEHPDPGTMIHTGCGGEITGGKDGIGCSKCGEWRDNPVVCFVEERDENGDIQKLCYEEWNGKEHFFRHTPSLPDVMEDGEKLPGQTLNLAYLTVNINNGRSKPRIFVGLNYVTDFSGNRAMLCFHGEEAKVLFGFDPNETHHVQNNQIVKVEV